MRHDATAAVNAPFVYAAGRSSCASQAPSTTNAPSSIYIPLSVSLFVTSWDFPSFKEVCGAFHTVPRFCRGGRGWGTFGGPRWLSYMLHTNCYRGPQQDTAQIMVGVIKRNIIFFELTFLYPADWSNPTRNVSRTRHIPFLDLKIHKTKTTTATTDGNREPPQYYSIVARWTHYAPAPPLKAMNRRVAGPDNPPSCVWLLPKHQLLRKEEKKEKKRKKIA